VIEQGEVCWTDLPFPGGSEPGYRHPVVVVQNNLANGSRIGTAIVCLITSNLWRAKAPGNVLLQVGEANLPRQSVVNVSQVATVDKSTLTERIGQLSPARVRQVVRGLNLLLRPSEVE